MGSFVQITPHAATITVNGVPKTVHQTHPNFAEIRDLLMSDEFETEDIEELMDVRASIAHRSHGSIVIEADQVLYKGQVMHGLLAQRLVEALEAGGQYFDRLIAFADNYYANPSYRAREQLWPFLEKGQNPIDEHGRFLAWKLVRSDYRTSTPATCRTTSVPSSRWTAPRSTMIPTAPARPASTSAHGTICPASARLVEDDRVMIVAVDPKDVVAVPTDYDNAKMRVCRYAVVGEVSKEDAAHAFEGLSFVDSDEFADGTGCSKYSQLRCASMTWRLAAWVKV
jgi:hypothetical protein